MSGFTETYKFITDSILADLKKGVATWERPWKADGTVLVGGLPVNLATGQTYRGINTLLLWISAASQGFGDTRWATFNQVREAGGTVIKGSKATRIFYTSTYERAPRTPEEEKQAIDGKIKARFLKGFNVFNLAQIEGIEAAGLASPIASQIPSDVEELTQTLGAKIRHGGDAAFFMPSADYIGMPQPSAFNSEEHYKATLLHELTHWTGHESRLNRLVKNARFKSLAYAQEELVAELGAAFLCAELGVTGRLQHSEYIASWIRLLSQHEQAFYTAAVEAQRAVDFIRERVIAAPARVAA